MASNNYECIVNFGGSVVAHLSIMQRYDPGLYYDADTDSGVSDTEVRG